MKEGDIWRQEDRMEWSKYGIAEIGKVPSENGMREVGAQSWNGARKVHWQSLPVAASMYVFPIVAIPFID